MADVLDWRLPDPAATVFFFNDTATTEIYTLSLHDALPLWQLRAEVRPDRRLRARAPGHLRQHQARTPRPELPPLHLGVVHGPGGLPAQRTGATRRCACAAVNDVGKPCAGELHARFDRGPLADQPG